MIDLRPACDRLIVLLQDVRDEQLAAPTPCTEYTVGGVVGHIDEAARGFTALARREAGEPADRPGPVAAPGSGWRDGVAGDVRELGEAWRDPAAWQGSSTVAGVELSHELWGRIALTEVVVHGWDIARATDLPFELPVETLRACFDHVARFVPNAPFPALWGPAVRVPADAPLLERVVAVTGRTP